MPALTEINTKKKGMFSPTFYPANVLKDIL